MVVASCRLALASAFLLKRTPGAMLTAAAGAAGLVLGGLLAVVGGAYIEAGHRGVHQDVNKSRFGHGRSTFIRLPYHRDFLASGATREKCSSFRVYRLRDRAIIAVLLGCALRRSEVAALTMNHIQQRQTGCTQRFAILSAFIQGALARATCNSQCRRRRAAGRYATARYRRTPQGRLRPWGRFDPVGLPKSQLAVQDEDKCIY
jgi:hypothetical protein